VRNVRNDIVQIMTKAELVKKLREEMGLGLNQIMKALKESDWFYDKAVQYCWDQYNTRSKQFKDRKCREGRIVTYAHHGNQVAVLVEIGCETDFAARTQEFLDFGQQIAMQVVAMNPTYMSRETVPQNDVDCQLTHIRCHVLDKYDNMECQQIIDERMNQWYRHMCLLEQGSIFNHQQTVEDLRAQISARLGENVEIRRWCRWELGET